MICVPADEKDNSKVMTYGSLFSGICGIDLGFDRAGMECKWQVEIDPYARRVLAKHWPEVPKHDDITTFVSEDWPRVDIIAGGFPCQDISYAGKGAGLAGERSGLFFEAVRIIREMGPRIVVLENVAALLTRGLGDVLGTLASIGYDAEWHCIPAAAVGAPHIRDRVFVLAYSSELRRNTRRPEQPLQGPRASGEALPEISDTDRPRLAKRQRKDASGARPNRRAKPGRDEWWSTEPDVDRVANGVPARVDRLRGLGNAVVPQVAEYIGRQIMECERSQHDTPKQTQG